MQTYATIHTFLYFETQVAYLSTPYILLLFGKTLHYLFIFSTDWSPSMIKEFFNAP